jgi:hypothetical protein
LFRADGRAWFSTRGMIESDSPGERQFEIAAARRLAERLYPDLLTHPNLLDGRTLIFELIHPEGRKVTNYGDRSDLVLLAAFDQRRTRYLPYPELAALAQTHGLTVIDALTPAGATLGEQIADLLASLAGTDQEGSVLTFERDDEVIYRVKVKSPDYLRLMRVLAECTYDRAVSLLDANPTLTTWEEFEAFLMGLGREKVPEEVIGHFRLHFDRFRDYLQDCERLRQWAAQALPEIESRLTGGRESPGYRKDFAALVRGYPYSGLLFAALDGRLDLARVRGVFRSPDEVRYALAQVRGFSAGRPAAPPGA